MEFAAIASVVSVVLGFLEKAKDASPAILEAAQGLADGAMNLVEKAKASIDGITHPTMTPAEVLAAMESMRSDLNIALADVRGVVPPPLSTE